MSAPEEQQLTIRVVAPEGKVITACSDDVTTEMFAYSALRMLGSPLDEPTVMDGRGQLIELMDILVENEYVQSCVKSGVTPTLYLNGAQPVGALEVPSEIGPSKPKRPTFTTSIRGGGRKKELPTPLNTFLLSAPVLSKNVKKKGKEEEDVVGMLPLSIMMPTGERIDVNVANNLTVADVKRSIFALSSSDDSLRKNINDYTLRGEGPLGNVHNESIIISSLMYVQNCLKEHLPLRFYVLQKEDIRGEKILAMKIGALIGVPIVRGADKGTDEISFFRETIRQVRNDMRKEGIVSVRAVEPYVLLEMERPPNMPNELTCKVNMVNGTITKTVSLNLNGTVTMAIRDLFTRFKNILPSDLVVEDHVIMVTGQSDYFIGDYELWRYEYIHNTALEGEHGSLNIVRIDSVPELLEGAQDDIPQVAAFDDIGTTTYAHSDITLDGSPVHPDSLPVTSLRDLTRPLRVKVVGVSNVDYTIHAEDDDDHHKKKKKKDKAPKFVEGCYVEVTLYHGQVALASGHTALHASSDSNEPRFNESVNLNFRLCDAPRAARLCFTLWGVVKLSATSFNPADANNVALGWANFQLVDHRSCFAEGLQSFRLWPGDSANPLEMCVSNPSQEAAMLVVQLDTFARPVVLPDNPVKSPPEDLIGTRPPNDTETQQARLNFLLNTDPLFQFDRTNAVLIWSYRYSLTKESKVLARFLMCVDWGQPKMVDEVHSLLTVWEPLDPVDALALLDANFLDAKVRAFGVKCLAQISDEKLCDYLLQLVQTLKYEPYHESPLARFLLKRALSNRKIGHSFFWYLKAEVGIPTITERFSLLIEAYLRGCGAHLRQLSIQNEVFEKLTGVANAIKLVKDADERKMELNRLLQELVLPSSFQILLNPRLSSKSLIVNKCKYMDSKKLPLWLVFENSDPCGKPIYIIFKAGDDLRQDMLTLQMFSIMDRLWEIAGLEVRLQPYGCVATGPDLGMIEVVMNAETIASIQMQYGGTTAAFKEEPLAAWLHKQHPSDEAYEKAVNTFTLSCAAYCVATYVLGIGDRHNDNIMMQKSGRLFHIDFGHFLGNIKRKFGVKRERTPFVLTPDMVFVMGGRNSPGFERFVNLCVEAHAILRKKANLFINLFGMMVSTGIPELRSTADLVYLQEALCVGLSDQAAADHFRARIFESIDNGWTTQVNWYLHNLIHAH